MSTSFVIGALVIALLGFVGYSFFLYRRVSRLAYTVKEKKERLDQTTKLLVKKNLEMFDQNVRQQKQLAARGDFVGIVSHQLRTPATELKWGLESLESDLAGLGNVSQRESVRALRASAERMVQIIDSLVKLVNLDQRYAEHSTVPFNPDAVVQAVAQRQGATCSEKQQRLVLELQAPEPIDTIDAGSLDMVVSNIIENAIHYTPSGGTITVTTKKDKVNGSFSCAISDTGIGMSPEKQKTVFVKFQRAEKARQLNTGGMGLGLYIAKNLTERHGGQISFTSEEGKGTTFCLTLPAKRPSVV